MYTHMTSKVGDEDKIMTGCESYPIIGDQISAYDAKPIIKRLKGLNLYWNCLEKALIVSDFIPGSIVVIGSLMIYEWTEMSAYGHKYKPPYEFHAWVRWKENVIDFGLPGVILKGLNTEDIFGPLLKNTVPVILAGEPPSKFMYKSKSVIR